MGSTVHNPCTPAATSDLDAHDPTAATPAGGTRTGPACKAGDHTVAHGRTQRPPSGVADVVEQA